MDVSTALVVLGIASIGLCVRAYRWSILLHREDTRIRLRHVLSAHLIGVFFGMLTPGKIGEHSKGVYVCKHYPGMLKNLFSTVVDRYIELLGFLVVSAVIIGRFVVVQQGADALFNYYFWGTVGFFCLLLFGWPMSRPGLLVLGRFASGLGLHGITDKLERIRDFINGISTRALTACFTLTVLFWALQIIVYSLVARGLGIPLGPVEIGLSAILAVLAVMLPISVGGLGTREAALVYVFRFFGQSSEQAISLGIIIFSYNVFFALIGLVVFMLEDGLGSKSRQ
jgi:uncharacterized protein (TIRG00374 family)